MGGIDVNCSKVGGGGRGRREGGRGGRGEKIGGAGMGGEIGFGSIKLGNTG